MTVQKFILLYNDTFEYIRERWGAGAVRALWKELSEQWCNHLDELVGQKGLAGMEEYWGGDSGTLSREKAVYETRMEDGQFCLDMHECPSVGEIYHSGRVPMYGEITYCDHCLDLYGPIAEKYGYGMENVVEYLPDGQCSGRCHLRAWKMQPGQPE